MIEPFFVDVTDAANPIVNADTLTTADVNDSLDRRYVTDDDITIITGQNALVDSNYTIDDDNYPVDIAGSDFPSSDWIVQTNGSDIFGGWQYIAG